MIQQGNESLASTKDILDDILALSLLKDDARSELLEILEHTRGRKCLVVDSNLEGLLNQIIVEGSRFLTDNGVQYFRELKGDSPVEDFITDGVRDYPDSILYLVRPITSSMRAIADQIKGFFKLG